MAVRHRAAGAGDQCCSLRAGTARQPPGATLSLNPDEADAVQAAIDAARLAPRLAAAMATLRRKDWELLRLVGGDGLSPSQAGAVLGMNAIRPVCGCLAPGRACRACSPRPTVRGWPPRTGGATCSALITTRSARDPELQPGHGAGPVAAARAGSRARATSRRAREMGGRLYCGGGGRGWRRRRHRLRRRRASGRQPPVGRAGRAHPRRRVLG